MKRQRRQALRAGLPKGFSATLPVCHDWTGVVALSPPFHPYKYQGRETHRGDGFLGREDLG